MDGHIGANGILLNANNEPYLQIVFQDDNLWNLRSYDPGNLSWNSQGVNSHGLGIGAITQTTNGTSVAWLLDHGMPDETTASNRMYAVKTGGTLSSMSAVAEDGAPPQWTTLTNLPGTGNSILLPLTTTNSAFCRIEVSLP